MYLPGIHVIHTEVWHTSNELWKLCTVKPNDDLNLYRLVLETANTCSSAFVILFYIDLPFLQKVIPSQYLDGSTIYHIQPSGSFVVGGPQVSIMAVSYTLGRGYTREPPPPPPPTSV